LLLLQRRKLRSSGEAPEAPCCNAASSGAPELAFICNAENSGALEKLRKLLATTQQASELRSLLLLQRSFCCNEACCSKLQRLLKCCNKLQAPELLQSLLARVFVACKEEGLFFCFWAVEKKKAFFFVFFAVEEKEEEP
jgi:hypothetical protein